MPHHITAKLRTALRERIVGCQRIAHGIYRITTESGHIYALKRMRKPRRQRFVRNALIAVRRKGFADFSGPLSLRVGRHELQRWIGGRGPDTRSPQDMEACARTLARFHAAARGRTMPLETSALGTWPAHFHRRLARVQNAVGRATSGTRAGDWWKSRGPAATDRIRLALSLIASVDYDALCRQARAERTLCHGDSGGGNFVMAKRGPVLIDFETLRTDLQAFDVYRLLRLAGKRCGWRTDVARAALSGYARTAPLAAVDQALVRAWLLLPESVCSLASARDPNDIPYRELLAADREEAGAEQFANHVIPSCWPVSH